jgi:histidyl-tRNA synthetase
VYESYGFEPLETPAVENLETLMGKYGEEGNQLIFKILKRGEKLAEVTKRQNNDSVEEASEPGNIETSQLSDLALRYDLTVPLARVVAHHRNELPKFFKRYQIQPVWRADRPARGRFREFYQCDVDAIGSTSTVVEAEIISAACDILLRLGFRNFSVLLNHRDLLRGVLEVCGIEIKKQADALVALDKLYKIGRAGVAKELEQRGIGIESIKKFIEFLESLNVVSRAYEGSDDPNESRIQGARALNDALIESLKAFLGENEAGTHAIAEMGTILDLCHSSSASGWVHIFPSLARGLSYYTGAIMEIGLAPEAEHEHLGVSIGGGGRYDGLIGMFSKEQIPACGFSLGLERILVVMEERGMFPPEIADSTPADVLVTIFSEDTISGSLKLAQELRSHGLRVTVYPQADKEDKQWKYANSIKVPWICTVNAADLGEGMVSFQDLRSRQRYREPIEQAAAKMREENA